MTGYFNFSEKTNEISNKALKILEKNIKEHEEICEFTSQRVLKAFQDERVSESHFAGSTGYGYNDNGRETLDRVFAKALESEDAIVSSHLVNGTHTLTVALFGLLQNGDTLLSVTGKPYDTLYDVIGINDCDGSLKSYGINYKEVDFNGEFNYDEIKKQLDNSVKVVFIQKSKGYLDRKTLSSEEIGKFAKWVKSIKNDVIVMVDNCYGEFCEKHEPCYYGADITAGSLIKNPGGSLAKIGGYIAGRHDLVEKISYRLTSPGVGRECGATLNSLRDFYQGIFIAPHVVLQAKKTAIFAAACFELMGYKTNPLSNDKRFDIIQSIVLKNEENIVKFCKGIQFGAPIDSFVTPTPWEMPGYSDKVIMAAGTFVSGASIELSADAPIREPYLVYFQGGITFETAKIGILKAVDMLIN